MFKLDQTGAPYFWPVKYDLPIDGGQTSPQTFDAKFKRIPQSKIEKILAEDWPAKQICHEVLVGWRGVEDNGSEMPYSEGARDRLLEVALVAGAITAAWMGSLSGAKAKN